MTTWTDALALGIAACGVIAGVAATLSGRRITAGVPVMLDLWMAGGLLKLSAEKSWAVIGIAALVVALRKLVVYGLARTAR